MADIPNPKWYDEGTVALTQGRPAVTGTGTFWVSAGVQAGDIFLDADKKIYEITAVNDSTSLTLGGNYTGATGSGKGYSIIRVFNSTMNATLANRISTLLSEFEQRYDLDMQTITPKSAYDIAKDEGYTGTQSEWLETLSAYGVAVKNGYTGTAEQWLESLKAGNEWSALNTRTEILTLHNAGTHNAFYRGKNLGNVFTEAQSAAIRAGTFIDLYPGDYWPITTTYTYYVATGDKTAVKDKTYYANVNGTALSEQPEEGADISGLGYYEAVNATATVNWRIADLDYYLKSGDHNNGLATHHAVIVPDTELYRVRMNATDTTKGGYVGTEMYTKNLARAKALITAAFGSGHVLTHREYLTNAVTDGKPSGGVWLNSTVELMTEQMVYGGRIRAAGNNAEETAPALATVSKSQLSLFRFRPDLMITGSGANRLWYWLRDVVNGVRFAVAHLGYAATDLASYSGGGVRPAFLIC